MEQWKEYRLEEIGTVVGGATPSTKETTNYDGEIPWITPKDLSNHNDRYIYRGERMITQKGFESCSCKMLPKGSVLFSSRAPIGYVAIAGTDMCTNQGFKSVVPNNEIVDTHFLYYLLLFNKAKIEGMGSGTTFKEVSGNVMKSVTVSIPNLTEQKRIADFLSSLDDKIELNRQINDNLEQQAQALFKSWFVDFEPFKDGEFVDSELGMIPKGWRVGTLSELSSKMISGDWGKETLIDNYTRQVFCIRGADIPDIKVGNRGKMPIRFILEKNYNNKALTPDDLVVEISGGSPTQSTGRICQISSELISYYDNSIICTNFCKAISPIKGYSAFVYYLWNMLYDQGVMFLYENGTTGIKNLDISGLLDKHLVIIPTQEIATAYSNTIKKLTDKILLNSIESANLSQLRDTLLPRLMSGELKINEINC